MKSSFTLSILMASLLLVKNSYSQSVVLPDRKEWNANWIAAPNDPGTEYGVYYFRKTINLAAKPANFIIHISADNR